jgi:NCAIR mutase (PurE)-related protein
VDKKALENLLLLVSQGKMSVEAAQEKLAILPYEDLGFAKPDYHRAIRQGFPEVIFGEAKSARQIIDIAKKLKSHHALIVATRVDEVKAKLVLKEFENAEYLSGCRCLLFGSLPVLPPGVPAEVSVITAGTADIPVAEEVALLLVAAGKPVSCIYDTGVAGIKRLFDSLEILRKTKVTVVIAGMDGALPSFVAGLIEKPVIAIPTSVGYGTSFNGVAPLLTMLNSCAPGLTVVNIDNGYGAAMACLRILGQSENS